MVFFEIPFFYLTAMSLGLVMLIWSADRFVDAATSLAAHCGIPTLLIGILIVGFGTSAPEFAVSSTAAINGSPTLALGNAMGSNIANIGLILGTSALISPVILQSDIVKQNISLALAVMILIGFMLVDASLTFVEGVILLIGFAIFVIWSIMSSLKHKRDALLGDIKTEIKEAAMSLPRSIMLFFGGLVILIASSQLLVWGSVGMAKTLGISNLIIGLTIIAIGTSLPELATSIMAIKKGDSDIAIGNVVGSNIFNILAVIGTSTVIAPATKIAPEVFYRDWSMMFAMSMALFLMAYAKKGENSKINSFEGAILLLFYIMYTLYLVVWILKTV